MVSPYLYLFMKRLFKQIPIIPDFKTFTTLTQNLSPFRRILILRPTLGWSNIHIILKYILYNDRNGTKKLQPMVAAIG